MNALFGIACTPSSPMFESVSSEVWFAVYQAFDEGEYQHPGDGGDVVPADKYTRPRVEKILASGDWDRPTAAIRDKILKDEHASKIDSE